MGGACSSSDLKCNTPFGSCTGGSCQSTCWSKKAIEEPAIDPLEVAVKLQLKAIESMFREKMIESLKTFGEIPNVHLLDGHAQSPDPLARALTVRIKNDTPDLDVNGVAINSVSPELKPQ